jgi:hypothetical protein
MKVILIWLSFLSLLDTQCNKQKTETPSCINRKIGQIKAEPKWNPAAEVNEYIYQGRHVYLFTSNCCDQYIMLYDGSCTYLCAPSGGIAGRGDGKCTDFYTMAKHVRLVWKDPR